MASKTWVFSTLMLTLLTICLICGLNVLIDPLWLFGHSHSFNSHQNGFNERLQKSLYLRKQVNTQQLDALLFGSSRVTYYNVSQVQTDLNIFNYSFSYGVPGEFINYLSYAKGLKGSDYQYIILGLDFIGPAIEPRISVIDQVLDDFEIYKKYATLTMLKHSWKNIKNSLEHHAGHRAYTRSLDVLADQPTPDKVLKIAEKRIESLYKDLTFKEQYFEDLKTLKRENPNTQFIIFTTPLSQVFLDRIGSEPYLKKQYFKWLKELTAIFNEVHFYTHYNDLAKNFARLSKDGGHFYNSVGHEILRHLLEYSGQVTDKKNHKHHEPNCLLFSTDLEHQAINFKRLEKQWAHSHK